MTNYGPDPSEALPIGEEVLTLEQLGRLAVFMFEFEKNLADLSSQVELTSEQHEAVQRLKDQIKEQFKEKGTREVFELIKQEILHPPA